MEKHKSNGTDYQLSSYETPFADVQQAKEEPYETELENYSFSILGEVDSPFKQTFETPDQGAALSTPATQAYAELLAELNDPEFETTFYNLAAEAEDSYLPKISSETAMGDRYIPYVTQQVNQFLNPLQNEAERILDSISEQFSGNNLADINETDLEIMFEQYEIDHAPLSPAQEQFLGSLIKKAKSVVKAGVNLAKKGIAAVGKILPINIILKKLKGFVNPLLKRVLQFAINKLPKQFQPHAQTLASKILNMETSEVNAPASGDLEAVQYELDTNIANLLFSGEENESDTVVQNYLFSSELYERELSYEMGGLNVPPLDTARQQFINELKDLKPGESPVPAIENFLPAALLAAQPLIKMAIGIIGRPRIINFLAGLLAQLVAKYIPKEVAKPLAAKIIDVGMGLIGFETYETNRTDLAYEAIANTIEETIQNIGPLTENLIDDQEMLTSAALDAFESAAANNFPDSYIKEEYRKVKQPGMWVLMPRGGAKHMYKKFTHAFPVTINPSAATTIKSFNGVPLASFMRDKLGLDPSKPIQARVHIYEAIEGTWLSRISQNEKVPGLGVPYGWVQLHPLTTQAASMLLNEPCLGKDVADKFLNSRHKIAIGQRFFFLEINGAHLKLPKVPKRKGSKTPGKQPMPSKPQPSDPGKTIVPRSTDIQGVINVIKAEIRINYFFSEEDSKSIVEKLNRNDYLGAALSLRYSVRNVLQNLLIKNVGSKVKIIHESIPELYLDNIRQEQFAPLAALGSLAVNAGKDLLIGLVQKLIEKIAELAYQALVNYFKARAAEFKQTQAMPDDGVTVKIIWVNIPGMSTISTILNAVKGRLSVGNLADLVLPNIPTPEVQISAGKNFD